MQYLISVNSVSILSIANTTILNTNFDDIGFIDIYSTNQGYIDHTIIRNSTFNKYVFDITQGSIMRIGNLSVIDNKFTDCILIYTV